MIAFWEDLASLLKEPLAAEALAGAVLFVVLLLALRKTRRIAAELERRKALSDYVRGLDEFLRGDYREGIATLEKVLERDPENVEARIALGDCYRETGDAAEAKKHHHHVHKVFGHELARNFLSLGRDELALHHYDLAVEAFERAEALAPGDTEALSGIAQAYAEGGQPVAAAERLREIYPRGPGEEMGKAERRRASRRFEEAGAAVLAEGDARAAVRFLTEAIAFQPGNLRARSALVRAAQALGEAGLTLAREHLEQLRELAKGEDPVFEPAPAARTRPAAPDAPNPTTALSLAPDLGALVVAVEARTARYSCGHCGELLKGHSAQCPKCGAVGTVQAIPDLAAFYMSPLPDIRGAVDEVEETAAFVHALAFRASTGDEAAMTRLLEKGPGALYEVFAALPGIEARRYLGARLAALGAVAAREVGECNRARPQPDFAAAFYLALGERDAESFLPSLGNAQDPAVAGALADPRLDDGVRDRALEVLRRRGPGVLGPVVEAVAASRDAGGLARGASLVRSFGDAAVSELERRFLEARLLGRLFGARGTRRRAVADMLARSGLPAAAEALGRAAAREKDGELRAHYAAARDRAATGGGP